MVAWKESSKLMVQALAPDLTLYGSIIFSQTIGSSEGFVVGLQDGNYLLAWGQDNQMKAIKISLDGTILQNWSFNGSDPNQQHPTGAASLSDGRFVISFYSNNQGKVGRGVYMSIYCLNNSHCMDPTASKCMTSGAPLCSPCTTNSDCSHLHEMGLCIDGRCVNCTQNSHCPTDTLSRCQDEHCSVCLSNDDCTHIPDKPYCDINSGKCIACFDDSYCTDIAKAKCEIEACVPCNIDSDCFHFLTNRDKCVSGVCKLDSSLSILGPSKMSGYRNIQLEAVVNAEEASYYNLTFIWTVTTSPNVQGTLIELITFLSTQTGRDVTVPASLVEPDVEYHFKVSYENADSDLLEVSLDIMPICTRGKFYKSGLGCSGVCIPACNKCTDDIECIECATFASFNPATKVCEMTSYLNISGPSSTSACNDLRLSADINPGEAAYTHLIFMWSVHSTSVNTTLRQSLDDYIETQTTSSILIPSSYLEKGIIYTFYAKYVNLMGQEISNSLKVTTGDSDLYPSVTVDGGQSQIVTRNQQFILKLIGSYTGCFSSNRPLIILWEQQDGPEINFEDFLTKGNPLWMTIPKCTLKPSTTYIIEATVFVQGYPQYPVYIPITLSTEDDKFYASIKNGNRDHKFDKPLSLEGTIIYLTECPDTYVFPVNYSWSCSKTTTMISTSFACDDPNGYFGTENTEGILSLPVTYYDVNDILTFTLTVKRNGKTSTTTTKITITSYASLSVSLSYADSQCQKYTAGHPPTIIANLQNETYNPVYNLIYTWTVSPSFGFFVFQNRLKLADEAVFINEILQINLMVANSTRRGSAFLEIPYNTPPMEGTVVIDPAEGYVLDTYFSITTKDWIEEDVPIYYQFFYTTPEGKMSPLSSSQQSPYLTTRLAGTSPNTTVILSVIATDNYGAQGIANTSVLVIVPQTSVAGSVQRITEMLSSLPSKDPYEDLKMQTQIFQYLLDIETNVLTF